MPPAVETPDVMNREQAMSLLECMLTIRHFEVLAGNLFAAGKLPGFIHLSIGQEAVAAGVCAALEPDDYITTTHRGHGHCIAKGGQVTQMMAELYGREGGYALGRSGSMHIADNEVGILGANAIVGGGIPMAVGGALAAQLRSARQVSVAFFGDGAAAEGVLHECLNLAMLWSLPVVFVCEHNGYAEMTSVDVHLANPDVTELARAYRMPAADIDGNDVEAVLLATAAAVARARQGAGPSFIQARTTRLRGHFEGDPQKYRSREDVSSMADRDPIAAWKATMAARMDLGEDEYLALDRAVSARVEQSALDAEAMPLSPPSGMNRHVYAQVV